MGDRFYSLVRALGRPAFWVSSTPTVIGRHHLPPRGPFIIAATHQSAYDIPLLMRHCPRPLDFVSITEVFANPLVGRFYGAMNAFPLDRSRRDPAAVRTILDRLRRGRVVAMFPEGGFRRGADSVVHSGRIRPGIGRIAKLAGVAVVPCVIRDSLRYSKFASWLPLGRTRYGMAFGEPLPPGDSHSLEDTLVRAYIALNATLANAMLPMAQRDRSKKR